MHRLRPRPKTRGTVDDNAVRERMSELVAAERAGGDEAPTGEHKRRRDDAADDGPAHKRPCSWTDDIVLQLRRLLGMPHVFEPRRRAIADLLTELGVCRAARVDLCRSDRVLAEVGAWLDRRRDRLTLVALRMQPQLSCPGDAPTAGRTPCHLPGCRWRLTEDERAPVRDAPISPGDAPSDDVLPLASMPPEIVAHIVRLTAYDFESLRQMRATCRGLRSIVDATLPTILVDLGLLRVARECWECAHVVELGGPACRPVTIFRGRPCQPFAAKLLASPARTLTALVRHANARQWEVDIARLHWAELWDDKYRSIMKPCPTDRRMAYVLDLIQRYRETMRQCDLGFPPPTSAHAMEADLARFDRILAEQSQLRMFLAAPTSAHPILYAESSPDHYLRIFMRLCLRSGASTAKDVHTVAERVLHAVCLESSVIRHEIELHGVSAAALRRYGPLVDTQPWESFEDLAGVRAKAIERVRMRRQAFYDEFPIEGNIELVRSNLAADQLALLDAAERSAPGRGLVRQFHALLAPLCDEDRLRALWEEFEPVFRAAVHK